MRTKSKVKLSRKIIGVTWGIWMVVLMLTLGGCHLRTKPSTKAGNSSSTLVTTPQEQTQPGNQPDTSDPEQSGAGLIDESTKTPEATQPTVSKTTASIALEKFKAARESLQSEKLTHLWSVESSYPLKTGQIIQEANYNPAGHLKTGWGRVEETEGVQSLITTWYQTEQELVMEEGGIFQRYPLSQVQAENKYHFNRLIEKVLSDNSVSRESEEYYVKLTTQDEVLIQELMEYLGYRKTEQEAYQGNLFFEARLDEASGNLLLINYVFKQRVDGYTDNGSIAFKDWNIPISVEIPKPDLEVEEP